MRAMARQMRRSKVLAAIKRRGEVALRRTVRDSRLFILAWERKNARSPNWSAPIKRGDTNYLFVIKIDPLLDDLRGDPRFEALVQKVIGGK